MNFVENAYAKINVFLDVTGILPDGYHSIKTVMQSVSLCDTLYMDVEPSGKTEIVLSTHGGDRIPEDESNLVWRAVKLYLERAGVCASVNVRLEKRIPVGAGLGGGSSDAASALRVMNRVFSAFDAVGLSALAATLGSDVAFCLASGAALCEGRGEIITPIELPPLHLVIAIGEGRVSTPAAYRALDERFSRFDGSVESDGDKAFADLMPSLRGEADRLFNIFEEAIIPICPEISDIKSALMKCGASAALMSGSGAAVFGIFGSEQSARDAAAALRGKGYFAEYSTSV